MKSQISTAVETTVKRSYLVKSDRRLGLVRVGVSGGKTVWGGIEDAVHILMWEWHSSGMGHEEVIGCCSLP